MLPKRRIAVPLIAGCAAAVLGCVGGATARSAAPVPAAERSHLPYEPADVAFMQGMILHHGQALEMTALAESRVADASLGILVERIEATQENEIQRMAQWLAERGESVPDPAAYRNHAPGAHGAHGGHMAGMATPAEMERLAALSGDAFDRMFLELMIRHHEGALTMVAELQHSGGGLEAEIYRFASDVDADQRAEIARMRSMLTVLQRGSE